MVSFIKIGLIFLLNLIFGLDHPQFKGGENALENFLNTNKVYPAFAKRNCIQGTIYVSFSLDDKAQVINTKVKKGLGVDLDEEALRLIKLTSGKWELPANHNPNLEMVLPVSFSLQNYNCEIKSKEEIEKAITYYQAQQAIDEVIISYYKNKEKGEFNAKNEQEIQQLKAEMGYDEEFVSEKIIEAKQKIKKGDKDGACEILNFIKNIGFNQANDLIAENCK